MSIPYETALRLEEAGFPLPRTGGWVHDPNQVGKAIAVPNLSELIEGCGDDFNRLEHDADATDGVKYWTAYAWSLDKGESAATPDIAVSNLWLALQGK